MAHNNYESAIKAATAAMQLVPQSSSLRSLRGVAHYRKGDLDAAINDYNEAIRLSPDFAPWYVNRGATYYRKRKR